MKTLKKHFANTVAFLCLFAAVAETAIADKHSQEPPTSFNIAHGAHKHAKTYVDAKAAGYDTLSDGTEIRTRHFQVLAMKQPAAPVCRIGNAKQWNAFIKQFAGIEIASGRQLRFKPDFKQEQVIVLFAGPELRGDGYMGIELYDGKTTLKGFVFHGSALASKDPIAISNGAGQPFRGTFYLTTVPKQLAHKAIEFRMGYQSWGRVCSRFSPPIKHAPRRAQPATKVSDDARLPTTDKISDDERAALADLDSSDRFRSVAQATKQLSTERARAFVEYTERRARSFYGLTRLELSNVSEISDEVAKELAKHRGWLFLNGLTSISDEAAEALSQHHGRLYLNGLTMLSDEAAKSLAQHGLVPHRENDRIVEKGGLHLDGLTTLSHAAARTLAQRKGELWLRGLTTLSDEAAAALRRKRDVRLPVKFRGEENGAENSRKPSHRTYVYAKIILPMKAHDKGKHPMVESWIARDLRKRGENDLRAVTDWVRLGEGGEHSASIWNATVDGKSWGCPVAGRVAERTADGKVKVELSGWSPFGAKIEGNSLSGEAGSRGIATVDIGSNDLDGRAFVAFVIGPGKATHDQLLDAMKPGGKSQKSTQELAVE